MPGQARLDPITFGIDMRISVSPGREPVTGSWRRREFAGRTPQDTTAPGSVQRTRRYGALAEEHGADIHRFILGTTLVGHPSP